MNLIFFLKWGFDFLVLGIGIGGGLYEIRFLSFFVMVW